ncbi:MAG TPA: PA domain-containing protein [Thermoanaerobaculia bacterium]|nr:PA domain-containing protein [Thermoanaerobaculia bacterium]
MKRLPILLLLILAAPSLFAKATITIVNTDAAGKGFNDPTPAEPVGGNEGKTLGEQRLNAFRHAAGVWSKLLQSNVEILVNATFSPINRGTDSCNILGSAAPMDFLSNFEGALKQNVWYPVALANSLAGKDLRPGTSDITATFNSLLDTDQCAGLKWYYGLDGKHGDKVDLVVVLLHELAHGFGVSGTVNLTSGADLQGMPSVHEQHMLDTATGLRWDQMTAAQRRQSALNTGRLVWDGPSTRMMANEILGNATTLTVLAPSEIARNFDIGTASFGARADQTALTGSIVAAEDANDADGPSTTDGCSPYTNASAISGNIALVDRGTCTFVKKAQNAQTAGASGVLIVDNRRDTCLAPGMGGDDTSITIPIISINADDGEAIRAQIAAGVRAMLRVDPSTMAGASNTGLAKLYAPCTLVTGSSVFHWDVTASPNLLMEPAINDDVGHGVDLTINQLIDLGWARSADDGPPPGRRTLKRGR